MTAMLRRLVQLGLVLFGLVGIILVLTANESPVLVRTTTADGVAVEVPAGWSANPDRLFEYLPPVEANRTTDRWVVAWACGPDGCANRSREEWLALSAELPTFVNAQAAAGDLLFDLEVDNDERSRSLTARTAAGETQVLVAVFFDGADRYLECGANIFVNDDGLAQRVIDVCREAVPPR